MYDLNTTIRKELIIEKLFFVAGNFECEFDSFK